MTRGAVRAWYLVHKWTSLVCTAFLLMLCVTGLPLIFHDEIDAALGQGVAASRHPGPASSGTDLRLLPLDRMLAIALAERPGEVPLFMAFDNAGPLMTITTGPRPDARAPEMTIQQLDRRTGAVIGHEREGGSGGITAFLLQLHTDMFLGLKGELFLGGMGLLFVLALVSGTILYAPFMRKLDFGTLRVSRSRRVKWLDYHNLLGIVALAWMAVVGSTGIINALVTPITRTWQRGELAEMTRAYAGRPALPPARYGSIDRAMARAREAIPGMNPRFIGFPGGAFSSRHHYGVFFEGNTPLTERLLTTALIDAETGALTDARPMPWYFKALSLSRPLHFGDYGGLPLKILWALLDLFTIVVLGSGLYLWVARRRTTLRSRVAEVTSGGLLEPVPAE
ncbi:PepSY-associated TM helix domain-containing protein [Sphingomonas aracearum]|uniref:PepSY domain-containing protein n=1 Tax=Sphingomonas aracearum TaxID=2283317 RepID=A0A369W5C2_9SPHN|nr:PepSY domain-containing protein [Sphingomonas aracearum]RDE07271.1 PepSY domain-containing protein [Sphingomonas aracearum]